MYPNLCFSRMDHRGERGRIRFFYSFDDIIKFLRFASYYKITQLRLTGSAPTGPEYGDSSGYQGWALSGPCVIVQGSTLVRTLYIFYGKFLRKQSELHHEICNIKQPAPSR